MPSQRLVRELNEELTQRRESLGASGERRAARAASANVAAAASSGCRSDARGASPLPTRVLMTRVLMTRGHSSAAEERIIEDDAAFAVVEKIGPDARVTVASTRGGVASPGDEPRT